MNETLAALIGLLGVTGLLVGLFVMRVEFIEMQRRVSKLEDRIHLLEFSRRLPEALTEIK